MIAKIKNVFVRKSKSVEYFWAGYGSNPLKHLGIKDFSETSKTDK